MPAMTPSQPLSSRGASPLSRLALLAVGAVVAFTSLASNASAAQQPVDLGTADTFAALAGTTVTNAGFSTLNGDLGVSPGSALTGFPPGVVNGTTHAADPVAAQAQADLTTAYNDAAGRTPPNALPADAGGMTLAPGVYKADPSLGLTGTLTLDGQGDPNAVFVFQVGSALTTAVDSRVNLINGARPGNVYWQIGSSATLGTSSVFAGTIMALSSISMNDGVTLNGRALARNGAVTLINDTITVPDPTPAPGCVLPSDAALHAVESPTSEGYFPSEEWIGNGASQSAVDAIGQALDERFGEEGAPGANPLAAGLVGVVTDDYAREFVVVVDPSLVNMGELESELRSVADGAGASQLDVRVGAACRSAADLVAAEAVVEARQWHPGAMSATFGYFVDARTSTVNVTFGPDDQAVADALQAALGDAVTIESGTPDRLGRLDDGQPHWGGAGIQQRKNTRTECTSAFTVRLASGRIGSLTAGHCYVNYRNPNGHSVWSGPFFYGTTSGLSNYPRFDMIRIEPRGRRFSPKIHTDPGTPSSRTIAASGDPARGSFICQSGAFTRAKCGIEVTSVRTRYCDPSGCTRNLFRAEQRGQLVAKEGDSGAPVYNRFGRAGAAARGMVVARTKLDNFYGHKIRSIERHLNVRVLLGG